MSTALLGRCTFEDSCLPLKGKSEWGMDTLTRKMTGARSLAEAFDATLAQGQIYPPSGVNPYYLQTWDWDDNPNVATLTLNYKGLITGGTPLPDPSTEIVSVTGKTTSDFSTEGATPEAPGGLGRYYRKDLIWSMQSPAGPGDNGRSFKGFRDRYAVSAAMEFTYKSPQVTYRYIAQGRPVAARYNSIGFTYTLIIQEARIVLSDGTVFEGRDQEAFFDLTPIAQNKVVDFQAKNVIGSPYWECIDVIRLELGNAP